MKMQFNKIKHDTRLKSTKYIYRGNWPLLESWKESSRATYLRLYVIVLSGRRVRFRLSWKTAYRNASSAGDPFSSSLNIAPARFNHNYFHIFEKGNTDPNSVGHEANRFNYSIRCELNGEYPRIVIFACHLGDYINNTKSLHFPLKPSHLNINKYETLSLSLRIAKRTFTFLLLKTRL